MTFSFQSVSNKNYGLFLSENIDIPQQVHKLALPLLTHQNHPERLFRLNYLMMMTSFLFYASKLLDVRSSTMSQQAKESKSANMTIFTRARTKNYILFYFISRRILLCYTVGSYLLRTSLSFRVDLLLCPQALSQCCLSRLSRLA